MTKGEHHGEQPDIAPGDVVTLHKPHPCGSSTWEVIRVGADIGLKCQGCGSVVLLPRHKFRTRVKGSIRPGRSSGGSVPA